MSCSQGGAELAVRDSVEDDRRMAELFQRYTSASLAPSRSAAAVAARFVVCAAPVFCVYLCALEMSSASQSSGLVAVKLCYEVRTFRAFRLLTEPQTRLYWEPARRHA